MSHRAVGRTCGSQGSPWLGVGQQGRAGPWLPGGLVEPRTLQPRVRLDLGGFAPDNVVTCFLLSTWSSHVGACMVRASGFPDFSGLGKATIVSM